MAETVQSNYVLLKQDKPELQAIGRLLQRLTNFALDAVLIVLAVRFLLRFFGANPSNDFVAVIYGVTYPLVVPFSGMFSTPNTSVASFEVSTLIAMLVIGVLLHAIIRLIGIVTQTATYLDE